MRLCATQKKLCFDLARPKKGMLRPLRLEICMFQLCATEVIFDFARLETDMPRDRRTQKRYVATIATQIGYVITLRYPICDFERLRVMLRLCATHVAILGDPCCDFARPMLRLCATHVASLFDPCCGFA